MNASAFLLAFTLQIILCCSGFPTTENFFWAFRGGRVSSSDISDAVVSDEELRVVEPKPSVNEPQKWQTGKDDGRRRGIVLMDQFCDYHGGYLSFLATEVYGIAVIRVLSDYTLGYFLQTGSTDESFASKDPRCLGTPSESQLSSWLKKTGIDEIVAVYCESDSGLRDAELLCEKLNLATRNRLNEARRNKFQMIDAVGSCSLNVVRQRLCSNLDDALDFANKLGVGIECEGSPEVCNDNGLLGIDQHRKRFNERICCIVKPTRGVGSESVALCRSSAEVEKAFSEIIDSTVFGSPGEQHTNVLVQEFAIGTEYALDIVSKDGEHKVAALWKYDKRCANGAHFVYFGTELIAADTPVGEELGQYAMKVLDALDIKWGLTHTEVILTSKGPILVEVNCRQHNMDFLPMAMACVGYNCFQMLLAAYLGSTAENHEEAVDWHSLPVYPGSYRFGAMVHLVCSAEGILQEVNKEALLEIQGMESVVDLEVYGSFLEVGEVIKPTVDIKTDAGWVQLISDDKDSFQRDYNRIVELMPTIFITSNTN